MQHAYGYWRRTIVQGAFMSAMALCRLLSKVIDIGGKPLGAIKYIAQLKTGT